MELEKNWLLFYKYEDDKPVKFHELCCYGSTIWEVNGDAFTYGEESQQELKDNEAAENYFRKTHRELIENNFQVIREWNYDPMQFSKQHFKSELKKGVRNVVQQFSEDYPNRSLNTFGYCFDGGCMSFFVNVLERKKSLQDLKVEKDLDELDVVFNIDEWESDIRVNNDLLDIPSRLLLSIHREIPCDLDFDGCEEDLFEEFSDDFIESSLLAFEELIDEGVFTNSVPRENFLLLFQESDADERIEAVKRLNIESVSKLYEDWFNHWNED